MASDRARVSYDPTRDWRGLVAQQGRVTVEADWNEATAIDRERDRRLTLDVVGPVATPNGGYAVTQNPPNGSPTDVTIGAGTLYLGGERLHLDAPGVVYSHQPDWLDNSTDPLYAPPPQVMPADEPFELVYLLAAEQEVAAVEDPALADVALGGPDTMQRQRILQHFVRTPTSSGSCADSTAALGASLGQGRQLNPATMMVESATTLQVSFTTAPTSASQCQPVATGGYLGAENQLIRVKVTGVDGTGAPIIVWGFDDASFLYRVQSPITDSTTGDLTVTLASPPVDSFHFPANGQAVELLRDAAAVGGTDYIASAAGFVSTLTAAYDPVQMQLVIAGPLPSPDYLSTVTTPQLYLRVWQATVSAPVGQPTPLGDTGVAVTLTSSTGVFHPGDFWTFALRPIQPSIVYPDRYLEAPQPPAGPLTWACPLAVLTWQDGTATVASCVPPFSDLVELTAKGSCCTVDVGPADVAGGASLQALLESYANQAPVTVCLEPGTYTLPAPLILGPELSGLTLQGCRDGVILQAASSPGTEFILGLIVLQGVNPITIRGIQLSLPLVSFPASPASFANLPAANASLLQAYSAPLNVAIGISVSEANGLIIDNCTFSIPDPGQVSLFSAGILATSLMEEIEVTDCAFQYNQFVSPPTSVPFNDLATGMDSPPPPPYQVTFGYLQVPGDTTAPGTAPVKGVGARIVEPLQLHDAAIDRCLFEGLTVPVLVIAQLGTLRVTQNTARDCYAGFWFISVDNPPDLSLFDFQAIGNSGIYQGAALQDGCSALLDRIFVIAAAMSRVLPPVPPAGGTWAPGTIVGGIETQATATAVQDAVGKQINGDAPPLAAATSPDTGTSVSLRLDFRDCQVDAVLADPSSSSGAGLIVADLSATAAGAALVQGSRISSVFPLGQTMLLTGLAEATVTGNVVANGAPILPNVPIDAYSIALGPVVGPVVPPALVPIPAVAITGNVFIDDTRLPARPSALPADLQDWDVLNTVVPTPTPLSTSGPEKPAGT
jgi:hypothetical protein